MSKEDIIKSWKGTNEQPKSDTTPPDSPVGDAELPDEDLEQVAGGFTTEGALTVGCCTTPFCPTGSLRGCSSSGFQGLEG